MKKNKPSPNLLARFLRFMVRIFDVLLFVLFYLKELVVSSSVLAYDVVRPRKSFKHGIVAVPVDVKSDTVLLALINLISMTPGSLVVDLSPDKKILFVHSMYLDDEEEFKRRLKYDFERRIKKVFE